MRLSSLLCAVLVSFGFVYVTIAAPSQDQITNLPGLSTQPSFDQYSGYMSVAGYGQMFYWFVESQGNPSTDPLVLWLNGGPGCSSLGGLLSENGPWSPNENLDLVDNPYSWNKIANMLYLESPPGVGFSINQAEGFSVYTDNRTAVANYDFLQQWFTAFPEYQQNDFWITGESYAGHYIPTLVYQILQEQGNSSDIPINLQGFAVGNPSTDFTYDDGELYRDYFPSHGLQCLNRKLNGNTYGIINPYDILTDVCYELSLSERVRFPNPTMDAVRSMKEALAELQSEMHARDVPSRPPCIGDFVTNYLNQADVQSAIHAQPTTWVQCGGPPYQFGQESLIPYYQYFLANTNLRIMVYSGDADTVIPFMGTEQWVLDLNQVNKNSWGPWYSEWSGTNQVSGYWIDFGNIWYATVKGAGHMVPWFQPGAAFDMFSRFITDTPLHTDPLRALLALRNNYV